MKPLENHATDHQTIGDILRPASTLAEVRDEIMKYNKAIANGKALELLLDIVAPAPDIDEIYREGTAILQDLVATRKRPLDDVTLPAPVHGDYSTTPEPEFRRLMEDEAAYPLPDGWTVQIIPKPGMSRAIFDAIITAPNGKTWGLDVYSLTEAGARESAWAKIRRKHFEGKLPEGSTYQTTQGGRIYNIVTEYDCGTKEWTAYVRCGKSRHDLDATFADEGDARDAANEWVTTDAERHEAMAEAAHESSRSTVPARYWTDARNRLARGDE